MAASTAAPFQFKSRVQIKNLVQQIHPRISADAKEWLMRIKLSDEKKMANVIDLAGGHARHERKRKTIHVRDLEKAQVAVNRGNSAVNAVRERHKALAVERETRRRSRSKSPHKGKRSKSPNGLFAFATIKDVTDEFKKIHPGLQMSKAAKEWVMGLKKKNKRAMRLHLHLAGDISQYERHKEIVEISDLVAAQFVIHLGPSSIKIKRHHLLDLKYHK